MKMTTGQWFTEMLSEISGLDIARFAVMIAAISHLVLTPIHVSALLKLENQICGFVMFMFVLMGLAGLFEASRLKRPTASSLALAFVILLVVVGLGLYLASIYQHALANQRSLVEPASVRAALMLTQILVGVYGVCAALIPVFGIRSLKRQGRRAA